MKKAIIEFQGGQYAVTVGQKLIVNTVAAATGKRMQLGKTLAIIENDTITSGSPYLAQHVHGVVQEHKKSKKVTVKTYRRRKSSRKHYGHRQGMSVIAVTQIGS